MAEVDDLTPGLEGAEGAEDLTLSPSTPEGQTEGEGEGSGGDPLDEIKDEAARAEAKKHRAIARRLDKKAPEEKPDVAVPASQEFLTKTDFYKSNERKAVREATANEDVKANWDKIIPFYTPRRGKETPEDILEDIQDAVTLFKARNPEVKVDDSAAQLQTTVVTQGTAAGVAPKKATDSPALPNYKLPTQPKDWYPKKS